MGTFTWHDRCCFVCSSLLRTVPTHSLSERHRPTRDPRFPAPLLFFRAGERLASASRQIDPPVQGQLSDTEAVGKDWGIPVEPSPLFGPTRGVRVLVRFVIHLLEPLAFACFFHRNIRRIFSSCITTQDYALVFFFTTRTLATILAELGTGSIYPPNVLREPSGDVYVLLRRQLVNRSIGCCRQM